MLSTVVFLRFYLFFRGVLKTVVLLLLTSITSLCVAAAELVINTGESDAAPKAAWEEMANGFMADNPDVTVKINTFDHEGYKDAIKNFLVTNPPDVVAWYAGNRMSPFVKNKLFEDVSDVWEQNDLKRSFRAATEAMSIDGKQWGIPYTNYQWGIYYNKDVFKKFGLLPPKTWGELLVICARLKGAGVVPFTLGSKAQWPTGGWFDYLNLRTNGYRFHMDLTAGKVSYLDPRVEDVFDKWDALVRTGYFIKTHSMLDWQDSLPPLVKGEAAMILLGNFVVNPLRKAGMTETNLGFFQFPIINPQVALAEDAPMDTAHIPSGAKNKKDAKRFLTYISQPQVQVRVNQILGQLPVNNKARLELATTVLFKNNTKDTKDTKDTKEKKPLASTQTTHVDPLMAAGFTMLIGVNNLAQFYDRDASAEMAKIGLDGFQQYMVRPETKHEVLNKLERARVRLNKMDGINFKRQLK